MAEKVTLMLYVFAGLLSIGGAIITNKTFEREISLDGKIGTTNILRTTNDMSIMGCARNCDSDPNCVAFFVNPTTRTCQEQSALSDPVAGVTPSSGYRYYQIAQPAPFICPVHGGTLGSGQLPDGFYTFILFNDVLVDYSTAFYTCLDNGMNLPKIYEANKLNFYIDNIFSCPDAFGYRFWVDGTNLIAVDKYAANAWTTHDGIVIPQIPELWASQRPNTPLTQNCIQCKQETFSYFFDDCGCADDLHQILCEKKMT